MPSTTSFRFQNGWIFDQSLSPIKRDFWIFGLPILLGLCTILTVSQDDAFRGSFLSKPGLTIAFAFSILLDLPHVYSSFARIGMDHEDFRRRRKLYLGLPFVLFLIISFSAHFAKSMTISTVTYLNMIHRVRQDFGWIMYSRRMATEPRGLGLWIDKAMAYNLTIFPLLWLHTLAPKDAWWLFPGDLAFSVSEFWIGILLYIHWLLSGLYLGWVAFQFYIKRPLNLTKLYLLISIWVAWYVGLVFFNGSTWMIDFFHTMPYLFLIYHFGSRKWAGEVGWRGNYVRGFRVWIAYFGLVSLAYMTLKVPGADQNMWLYTLLVFPSVTHYVLDGFIWRTGPSNPDLSLILGFPKSTPVST